jgi:hypothetical protein
MRRKRQIACALGVVRRRAFGSIQKRLTEVQVV